MREVQLAIGELERLDPAERLRLRHEKYLKMGRWMEPGSAWRPAELDASADGTTPGRAARRRG